MIQDLPIDLQSYQQLTPHDDDVAAANALHAELRTRVATRSLHARSGDIEAVIGSVGSLIPRTRELLTSHPHGKRFETIALSVIDHVLRPRTNRWSRWLSDHRLDTDDRRRTFRRELAELQPALERVCSLLLAVAVKRELKPDDLFLGIAMADQHATPIRSQRALDPIYAEVQGNFPQCQKVLLEEIEVIAKKRDQSCKDKLQNAVGLALSGGGIRSATFSLGVVQVLARKGLFSQLDYLSTVSGGGYLGTYLSTQLNQAGRGAGEADEAAKQLLASSDDQQDTPGVRHLRNTSNYLLDGGFGTRLKALSTMIFGIATNLLVLLPIILGAVFLTYIAKQTIGYWGAISWDTADFAGWLGSESCAIRSASALGIAALGLQLVVRPIVSRCFFGCAKFRRGVDFTANWCTLLALALWILAGVPLLFQGFEALRDVSPKLPHIDWEGTAAATGILPLILGPLAQKFQDKKVIGKLLRFGFMISGPLFFLAVYLGLGSWFFAYADQYHPYLLCGAAAALFLFLALVMDLNALSPHHLYRHQLTKSYLVEPVVAGQTAERLGRFDFESLKDGSAAPYHLINATVNLPGSATEAENELRGRKGDFFLFSKYYCGCPSTDYVATARLGKHDPTLDIGSAMAISGAAFSSNMARKNLDRFRFFLTLLNVRLGYWIFSPKKAIEKEKKQRKTIRRRVPGPSYLMREMSGKMGVDNTFLNLSDGGHLENLGVYELLRRKCKYVISVDGECDPARFFDGLIKLIRYARIDLGAEIKLDPTDLKKDEHGYSPAHCLLGKIIYADGSIGWLLYLKLSLTSDESPDILDYQRVQPAFPHQSTLDQLYSERQFESYRALGYHVAEELFQAEILRCGGENFAAQSAIGETDLERWFTALAMNLLPDNDPVFRSDADNFTGTQVGISIANSPQKSPQEINDATRTVCEKIICLGATVVLGHDWRPDGIMIDIGNYASEDRILHQRKRPAIINRHLNSDPAPPAALLVELENCIDYSGGFENIEKLREELAKLSHTRICLGGKMRKRSADFAGGYKGTIPGILEEAWCAVQAGQPVLISGCLGGAAEWMAATLDRRPAGQAPEYDSQAAKRAGLPDSAENLVEDIREFLSKQTKFLHHQRLWKTTTLDAALAVMVEILDRHQPDPDK